MRKFSLGLKLFGILLSPFVTRILRRIKPFFELKGLTFVLRNEHVREVLRRDDVFHVVSDRIPKANVQTQDGRPQNFLLGLQRSPEFDAYQTDVMRFFRRDDLRRIAGIARDEAQAAVQSAAAPGRPVALDGVRGLVTRTAIAIVEKYYGVRIDAPEDFANCCCAASHYLFAPSADAKVEKLGLDASGHINDVIARSIRACDLTPSGDTILHRMGHELDDARRQAIVFGMIMGFVPTDTMAGGHILEVLLAQDDAMRHARAAANSGLDDDERLKRCLFEALRFKPLRREPLRICQEAYTVGEGTGKTRTLAKHARVFPVTASAMMDAKDLRHPRKFDPNRPPSDALVFGFGLHRCIGAAIAEAHLVQTFKPLLRRSGLRRAPGKRGKLAHLGPFPEHLFVTFDA